MMKNLAMLMILLAFGWAGYWVLGSWRVEKNFDRWFEDRRNDGWVAEYDDLAILGFPNRFDTTFTNLTLTAPDASMAWAMPFFQLFTLSYRPNHIIVVWPPKQTFTTPLEELTLQTDNMRASFVFHPETELTLNRANISVNKLNLKSTRNWQLGADNLSLAVYQQEGQSASYRIALRAQDVASPLANPPFSGIGLPKALSALEVDLTAKFDRTWTRRAVEHARPQLTQINLALAEISLGDLGLAMNGDITIDKAGYPNGNINIRAVNWREIVSIARDSPQVSPSITKAINDALNLVAQISGTANTIEFSLTFSDRFMRIGPITIAPAPVIKLR